MRILVIGGTGFIGVYLTRQLVAAGHDVVLLNRGNHPAPVEGLRHRRPIPIPGSGMALTHLGHCEDLARAMVAVLGNQQAIGQIYNISGDKAVTFDGLARACATAIGKDPNAIEIVHYDPAQFDFGKKKAFPMRVQHFFTDISKAKAELNWQPKFGLVEGLKDSYENDYLSNGLNKAKVDFSLDDQIVLQS